MVRPLMPARVVRARALCPLCSPTKEAVHATASGLASRRVVRLSFREDEKRIAEAVERLRSQGVNGRVEMPLDPPEERDASGEESLGASWTGAPTPAFIGES